MHLQLLILTFFWYNIILFNIILYHILSYYFILYYIILYYTVLCCNVVKYIILFDIVFYCVICFCFIMSYYFILFVRLSYMIKYIIYILLYLIQFHHELYQLISLYLFRFKHVFPSPQSHGSMLDLFMLNLCEAPSEDLCDEGEGQEPKIDGPTGGRYSWVVVLGILRLKDAGFSNENGFV